MIIIHFPQIWTWRVSRIKEHIASTMFFLRKCLILICFERTTLILYYGQVTTAYLSTEGTSRYKNSQLSFWTCVLPVCEKAFWKNRRQFYRLDVYRLRSPRGKLNFRWSLSAIISRITRSTTSQYSLLCLRTFSIVTFEIRAVGSLVDG